MQYLKRINFINIIISTILAIIFSYIIYNFLYPNIHYKNLSDFYIGTTIYLDHNKYLDIYIYLIYLLFFFVFTFAFSFIKFKNNDNKVIISNNETKNIKFREIITKIRNITVKNQYLALLGYIFLYPFNGQIYPRLIGLILLIILCGLADSYKNRNQNRFSPFAVAGILYFIFFNAYQLNIYLIDDHHMGETFAAFFMHDLFNLKYYKDIMLVHGYIDVIPAFLGKFIFNTNTLNGYLLGDVLFRNLNLIILLITGCCIFSSELYYIVPITFINMPSPASVFCIAYIILLKFLEKPWGILIYTIIGFIFSLIWTTMGTFWLLAALPLFIFNIFKNKNKKYICLALISLLILIYLFKEPLFYYFLEAKEYTRAYLFSFGNNFPEIIKIIPILFFIKAFVLFITPVFIIELGKELYNQNKSTEKILFLVFFTILAIVSLSYTLGRIDGNLLYRLQYISIPYLLIVLPYYLYIQSTEKIKKITKIVFISILIFTSAQNIFKLSNKIKFCGIKYDKAQELRIASIREYLKKFPDNTSFLDFTNRGMHYFYLKKKCPVKYTSFYNSITTNQSINSLKRLKNNPPDIILIKSLNNIYDNVFPSLRVNPEYRYMLLSGQYKYEEYKENGFLIKTDNNKYSNKDLSEFDFIFSNNNLGFLPEVWANSINTLPITKIKPEYYFYQVQNKLIIKFINPQKGSDIDLLYIANKLQNTSKYIISINDSDSDMICYSKSGKLLLPFDNFPSWMLNNNIKTITIESLNFISPEIEFYNKTERDK